MQNVIDFPNRDAVYEAAALWLVKMDERELNAKEVDELKEWLASSPEHSSVFRATLATWEGMSSLKTLSEYFPLEHLNSKEQVGSECRAKSRVWLWPASALIAMSILVVAAYLFTVAGIYQTGIGERDSVQLSDGSVMTLNTDTKLKVSYADHVRRIDLLRGEAFFEVAKDPQRPFLVVGDQNVVTAVGTAFSVFRKNDSIKVVVSEGVVQLQSSANLSDSGTSRSVEGSEVKPINSPVYLEQGEIGVFNQGYIDAKEVSHKQIERQLSWREDMLIFDGEILSDVIEEFQRYTETTFIVDSDVSEIQVGGYFRSDDIEGMLASLELNFGVQVLRLEDSQVLLKGSTKK